MKNVPGLDGRDVPSLGLEQIRRDLRRLRVEGVPVPLPASLYGPQDDEPEARRAVEAAVTDVGPGE